MPEDSSETMLTTIDNPWNPFTDWDEWFTWDQAHGYDTPGLLARIAMVSLDLSDADVDKAISDAIDRICQQNISGMYTKVMRPVAGEVPEPV
jgi:hypothetical protein